MYIHLQINMYIHISIYIYIYIGLEASHICMSSKTLFQKISENERRVYAEKDENYRNKNKHNEVIINTKYTQDLIVNYILRRIEISVQKKPEPTDPSTGPLTNKSSSDPQLSPKSVAGVSGFGVSGPTRVSGSGSGPTRISGSGPTRISGSDPQLSGSASDPDLSPKPSGTPRRLSQSGTPHRYIYVELYI
jgi:hypothetical protein